MDMLSSTTYKKPDTGINRNGEPVPKTKRCYYFKITDPSTGKISIVDKIQTDNPVVDALCPTHKTMTRCYTNFYTTKGGVRMKRLQYEHRDRGFRLRSNGVKTWPRCNFFQKVDEAEKKQQPVQEEHQKKMTKALIIGINPMLYNKFRIEAIENCKIKETEAIEQALILWTQDSMRKRTPELELAQQGSDLREKRKSLEAVLLQLKNEQRKGGEPFRFLTYKRHN